MIQGTHLLPPGTEIYTPEHSLRLGTQLGSGLIGVVYAAEDLQGRQLAVKRARARFGFFKEALRLEREVAGLLDSFSALRAAKILDYGDHLLVKEWRPEPTLAELIIGGGLSRQQEQALMVVLRESAEIEASSELLLDLSPKNLCWASGWVLLDSGPKIHKSSFSEVARRPSLRAYLEYFKSKLVQGRSRPSVMELDLEDAQISAKRWVYLRDWWRWFPCDDELDLSYYQVQIDESLSDDEIIFRSKRPDLLLEPNEEVKQISGNPAIIAHALRSHQMETGEALQVREQPSILLSQGGPLSLEELATEISPLGPGRIFKELGLTPTSMKPPNLAVQPYGHWRDLLKPQDSRCTDIYSHAKVESGVEALDALLKAHPHFQLRPLKSRARGICELLYIPKGRRERAFLFVPGFRASERAAIPLAMELIKRGIEGSYLFARVGMLNEEGQELVTAGRWETPLLFDILTTISECLPVKKISVLAASHGMIGASYAARLHPSVDQIILDSALARPLSLLNYLCKARGEEYGEVLREVQRAQLPHKAFAIEPLQGSHQQVLSLRRHQDSFLQVCGALPCDQSFYYEGSHAETMRHDSSLRGVPEVCVEEIAAFLQQE